MEWIDDDRRFSATLAASQDIAPGIVEIRMRRPKAFSFLPGQFVRFFMEGYWRDYTIVSGADAETIDFCIALVEEGRFSTAIDRARVGDRFRLSGPHGHFIFQQSERLPVFVATGTGVAPFVAFCLGGATDALLLHGVADSNQLIYRYALEPGLRTYVPCITGSFDARQSPGGTFAGRVTDYMERMLVPDAYDFYLCGRLGMIRDATALIDERFGGSRLFIENFD